MPVETRPTSRFWYGRWRVNGRRRSKRLKVEVEGRPGSDAFEQSRLHAEEALKSFLKRIQEKERSEDLIQSLHEVKFGRRIGSIPLHTLPAEWAALPRKRDITCGRLTFGTSALTRFVSFVHSDYPEVDELAAVTPEIAEAFMAHEDKRSITGRTYNAELSLLRGAFERLRVKAGMLSNPFSQGLLTKEENPIPRKPFTVEELERLFEVARANDAEMHDLITVGACTALRRGDACCLKWKDINFAANRIRIHTRKTGEAVSIPILPRLHRILNARRRHGAYVFPALAELYQHEPWTLNKRLRAVFTAAGFRYEEPDEAKATPPGTIDVDLPDDRHMRRAVLAKIAALTDDDVSPRIKATMREVYDLYSSGATLADVTRQLDISKGSASNYLTRIEKIAGHPIIRREVKRLQEARALAAAGPAEPPPERRDGKGKIRVNPRGFHALRATFTTQALAAGVPVEVVKLITGHTLTETVLKHYFNPNEEAVFANMERALPKLLTGR